MRATVARADVLVEGDEAAVRIVARQASVAEVFAALQSKFRFRYNLAVSPERQINGTIAGPLHRVVARLLDGYDFVVKRAPDGVEVVRVAPRGTASWTPQARPGVTVWQTPSRRRCGRRRPIPNSYASTTIALAGGPRSSQKPGGAVPGRRRPVAGSPRCSARIGSSLAGGVRASLSACASRSAASSSRPPAQGKMPTQPIALGVECLAAPDRAQHEAPPVVRRSAA